LSPLRCLRLSNMTILRPPVRSVVAWFAGSTLCALLLFTYKHLDHVARQETTPFYIPLIEEFTGAYGAIIVFGAVQWLARQLPLRRSTWVSNLTWHLGALLLFSAMHTTLNWTSREMLFQLVGLGDYDYGLMSIRYLMEFPIDVILYTLFAGGVWLFRESAAQREAALHAAQLENQLRHAQLQGLRLQLQPHFLFNALNTISAKMYDDPPAADTMLSRLAELLRVSLKTTQTQEVTLAAELEALEPYVALLRGRFGDQLSLRIEVEEGLRCALVPSLILQPLVENAVRHGNLTRLGIGKIDVTARRVGTRIRIEVEDDGPGAAAGVSSKGIGLQGTIERLQLLYGDAQRFETHSLDTGFRVAFEIPLRLADAAGVRRDEGLRTEEVYARADRG
jgi:two-component system, LytTR family, sensor kinase